MTKADQKRWDERYTQSEFPRTPSATVKHFHTLAHRGRALDIAAGQGRNSIFLARTGFRVDAVDISTVAVNRLRADHPEIHTTHADLDTYEIPGNTYDLIINVRFLDRRLFPKIMEGLRSGGVLIFESYLLPTPEPGPSETCRDYYLRKNELLHAFLPLHIHFYQETDTAARGKKRRVARLVGVKED